VRQNTIQLMTASIAHVTNLTQPGVTTLAPGRQQLAAGGVGASEEEVRRDILGGAVQVESIDPELESARIQPLNLKCDILVSKFAFKFNLHHSISATKYTKALEHINKLKKDQAVTIKVGLYGCSIPPDP
jgi:hypothetical protein